MDIMKPGQSTTLYKFHFSKNNKNIGYVQNSNLPDFREQNAYFEYHVNKDDAIKKYNILIKVDHPNISHIIGFDWRNQGRVIAYERTDFSLEDIISDKKLFWKPNKQGIPTMTEDFQKFIIALWNLFVHLHKENIAFTYEEDFGKIYLLYGKLREPKFYIMNNVKVTESGNDLKLYADILKSIILGILKRQEIDTSYRGWENLENMLDFISCCPNPLQALEDHPEISGTRGKIRNMKTVYDRLMSGGNKMNAGMNYCPRVEKAYKSWSRYLNDFRVRSVFESKRKRYLIQTVDVCGNDIEVESISGLVKLMRDTFHHVKDYGKDMKDEEIVEYFDWRFPNLSFDLHHFIHKINR